MTTLRIVMGDQLSADLPTLTDADPVTDIVLMMEVAEECTYVPHHQQKLVLFLSAMRHFADALRARGLRVDYVRLDEPGNTGDFTGEVERALIRHNPTRIVLTEPGEWRVQTMVAAWQQRFGRAHV